MTDDLAKRVEALPDWLQPSADELRLDALRERAKADPELAWLIEQYDDVCDHRADGFADAQHMAFVVETLQHDLAVYKQRDAEQRAEIERQGALLAEAERLCLEHCPEEMSEALRKDWSANQRPVSAELQQECGTDRLYVPADTAARRAARDQRIRASFADLCTTLPAPTALKRLALKEGLSVKQLRRICATCEAAEDNEQHQPPGGAQEDEK